MPHRRFETLLKALQAWQHEHGSAPRRTAKASKREVCLARSLKDARGKFKLSETQRQQMDAIAAWVLPPKKVKKKTALSHAWIDKAMAEFRVFHTLHGTPPRRWKGAKNEELQLANKLQLLRRSQDALDPDVAAQCRNNVPWVLASPGCLKSKRKARQFLSPRADLRAKINAGKSPAGTAGKKRKMPTR